MPIDFTKPTPLYRQIADHIESQIASGDLNAGDRLDSHQELSKYYGVSLITVKKALADLISKKILFSRVGKGTYVSKQIPQLNLHEDTTIGLILRDLNSPFFAGIVESVEKRATEFGCNLMLSTSSHSREKELAHIERYLKLGVRGLILSTSTAKISDSESPIKDLHSRKFPYYIISYIEDKDINYIGADQVQGAYIATKHLISLGYEKIGYINSERGYPLGEVRKSGYLKALHEAGRLFYENFVFYLAQRGEPYDYKSGYDIGQQYCSMHDRPDAMFIYNDLAALGFQKAVLDQGFHIPGDVAIVGFDDIKRGRVAPVPLTTIDQHKKKIGSLAVEMLLNMINKEPYQSRIILKPKLVVRDSCGAMETENQQIEL